MITTSTGDHLGDDFWLPFKKSAAYLGMGYIVGLHTISGRIELQKLHEFVEYVEERLFKFRKKSSN